MRVLGVVIFLFGCIELFSGLNAGDLILVVLGLVVIAEPDLLLWMQIRRNREAFLQPAEIVVTGEGLSRRTEMASLEFGWDKVTRVVEAKDFWVFMVNRYQLIALWKDHLTSEQRAELTTFLAARRSPTPAGPPPARRG